MKHVSVPVQNKSDIYIIWLSTSHQKVYVQSKNLCKLTANPTTIGYCSQHYPLPLLHLSLSQTATGPCLKPLTVNHLPSGRTQPLTSSCSSMASDPLAPPYDIALYSTVSVLEIKPTLPTLVSPGLWLVSTMSRPIP